ncbi:MAG: zinc ABC transporter substrate-binding protein [Verrucomicrobiota bacterium]
MQFYKLFIVGIVGWWSIASLSAESLKVAVSVLPQAGFVEQVGGSHVEVIVLVDEGKDPHSFSPTPKRVTSISEADIWFTSGMPFEDPLLEKMKQRQDGPLIVSMNRGIELAPSVDCEHHHHEEHEHAEGDEEHHEHEHHHHDHGEFDPHSWLSPALIPVQLVTIAEELGKLSPEYADEFEANASNTASA